TRVVPDPVLGDPPVFQVIRFIHVDEGANGMRAPARQRARHLVGSSWHKRMRAIAIAEQLVLTNDPGYVSVLRHQPERVKTFYFDSTKRWIGAEPTKSSEKRFLSRIGFRRVNEVSESLRYF